MVREAGLCRSVNRTAGSLPRDDGFTSQAGAALHRRSGGSARVYHTILLVARWLGVTEKLLELLRDLKSVVVHEGTDLLRFVHRRTAIGSAR